MSTEQRRPVDTYRNLASFAGDFARLARVATYPVTWVDDPDRTYLTALTALQAEGFACVLCGGADGPMVVAGRVDAPGCCQIVRHEDCDHYT